MKSELSFLGEQSLYSK